MMELTYDVLVHIFKYLSKFDRLSASETCCSWYEAANDQFFLKNKVVMFYGDILDDQTLSPFKTFEDTSFSYYHYHFCDVDITNKFNNFWNKKGDTIRTLTLEDCVLDGDEFIFILQKCTNLESLNIDGGYFCCVYDDQSFDEGLINNSLTKLKSLHFSRNNGLTDALLTRLLSAAPALEELDLSVRSLIFDPKEVKKYYPLECSSPSQRTLTFYLILQLIQSNANKIKCLKFINNIDSVALRSLMETKNLTLETLKMHLSKVVDLTPLTKHQVFLKELNLVYCHNLTDRSLIDICNNLFNLERLDIQSCKKVSDMGITELPNLKKLKYLNISDCLRVTQDGLIVGICPDVNAILEVLKVRSLRLDQNAVITMSKRLPNLRSLNFKKCHKGVTDTSLQFIFQNQQLLHTLNISHCYEVSDAGLTGMKIVDPDENPEVWFLSNFHQSPPMKKTKFVEEIVYVCEQELGIIFCAKRILDTGFSLSHLKRLKELDISGCYKITDISLAHAFNFESLIKLNLHSCKKLTRKGLEYLVKKCCTIEYLSVVNCDDLRDNDVKETVKGLKGLKRLEANDGSYLRARRPISEIIFVESIFLYNHILNIS